MWTVRVEWYSLESHRVGQPTGEFKEWHHKGRGVAALRRLGSLIAGKDKRYTYRGGDGVRLFVIAPNGDRLSYNQLRDHLKGA